MYIPDNYDIYRAYADEQERREAELPECCHCMKHITDDFCFFIEGDLWCEECMRDEFRVLTENYIE